MLRLLVGSLSLVGVLSSVALSQGGFPLNKAEEALRQQSISGPEIFPLTAPARPEALIRRLKPQRHPKLETHQLTLRLASCLFNLEKIKDEPSGIAALNSAVTMLEQNAELRISHTATEPQKAKLRLAARLDIQRAITKFRASITGGQRERFERFELFQQIGDLDMFGPQSLFAKVAHHQGLE